MSMYIMWVYASQQASYIPLYALVHKEGIYERMGPAYTRVMHLCITRRYIPTFAGISCIVCLCINGDIAGLLACIYPALCTSA